MKSWSQLKRSAARRARDRWIPGLPDAWKRLLAEGLRGAYAIRRLRNLRELGFEPERVLDIGAHEGRWTNRCRKVFPGASYLMVEAQPGKREILSRFCAESDRLDFEIALLGREVFESVDFFQLDTGSSIYREQTTYEAERVALPMRTLDELVATRGAGTYRFVKLDVQGAELDILTGGAGTLTSAEVVQMEVSVVEYNKGAPLFAEVVHFMDGRGFQIYDIFDLSRAPADAFLVQVDVIFVRKDSPLCRTGVLW